MFAVLVVVVVPIAVVRSTYLSIAINLWFVAGVRGDLTECMVI